MGRTPLVPSACPPSVPFRAGDPCALRVIRKARPLRQQHTDDRRPPHRGHPQYARAAYDLQDTVGMRRLWRGMEPCGNQIKAAACRARKKSTHAAAN